MDFRADFGEEVIVVKVGAPHGLVHVGHKANIRAAEDGTGTGCIGKNANFLRYLLTRAHYGFDALAWDAFDAAGCLQAAHKGACAEVVHKVVLVQGGFKCHLGLSHVAEYDGHFRAVPQEAYPGKVLAPGEKLGIYKIYLFIKEEPEGLFRVLPFIDYSRVYKIQEVHCGLNLFYGLFLALTISAAFGAIEIFESRRGYQQQAGLRLSCFEFFIHGLTSFYQNLSDNESEPRQASVIRILPR